MHQATHVPRVRAKSAIAIALTFAAGVVDIVSYIAVYHLFVAHMTGGTVHLGNKIAAGDWTEAAKAASVIFSFVAGSLAGRAIIEAGSRSRMRKVASLTLLVEAVLILIFIQIDRVTVNHVHESSLSLGLVCLLLSLLAAAMGLQTATLTRIGPLTIHTTFVTGMLNKFSQAVSQWAFWVCDQRHGNASVEQILRRSFQMPAFRTAGLMSAIWLTYVGGSVAGTWMNSRWSVETLYVPLGILLISIAVDQVQPLSIEEEIEQL